MPHLSIIVPHFGNTEQLEDTLASVLQNRPADCEVLVVHPGSYDDPYQLAGEIRLVEVSTDSTMIDGLNQAMKVAVGHIIHIASSGVEATEFWTQPALRHFEDPLVAAVTPLVLRRDKPKVIESAGVRLNRLGDRRMVAAGTKNRLSKVAGIKPLGPSLAAAFYRRQALEKIGWLSADVGPEFADVDTALALRQAGYQCKFAPQSELRIARPERPRDHAAFDTARCSERVVWRHAPALAGRKTLAGRLAIVPVRLLFGVYRARSFKQAMGRVAVWLEFGRHRRYWRELARIRGENLKPREKEDDDEPSPSSSQKTDRSFQPDIAKTTYKRAS